MISSAVWNKQTGVKFFKDDQKVHKPEGQVQFVVFEKNVQVLIYSKLHEKNHVITY